MIDENLMIRLLEELRKSNSSMQELKQLIPRLEKVEHNQNRLYNEFMVHQALMKPEDLKLLAEKVNGHDKAISIIQSELGISQKQIEEQKNSLKSYLNKAWDLFLKLLPAGGVAYLILEGKGIL